jgi:ribosome-associated translation inhibitor RaiA
MFQARNEFFELAKQIRKSKKRTKERKKERKEEESLRPFS